MNVIGSGSLTQCSKCGMWHMDDSNCETAGTTHIVTIRKVENGYIIVSGGKEYVCVDKEELPLYID